MPILLGIPSGSPSSTLHPANSSLASREPSLCRTWEESVCGGSTATMLDLTQISGLHKLWQDRFSQPEGRREEHGDSTTTSDPVCTSIPFASPPAMRGRQVCPSSLPLNQNRSRLHLARSPKLPASAQFYPRLKASLRLSDCASHYHGNWVRLSCEAPTKWSALMTLPSNATTWTDSVST